MSPELSGSSLPPLCYAAMTPTGHGIGNRMSGENLLYLAGQTAPSNLSKVLVISGVGRVWGPSECVRA